MQDVCVWQGKCKTNSVMSFLQAYAPCTIKFIKTKKQIEIVNRIPLTSCSNVQVENSKTCVHLRCGKADLTIDMGNEDLAAYLNDLCLTCGSLELKQWASLSTFTEQVLPTCDRIIFLAAKEWSHAEVIQWLHSVYFTDLQTMKVHVGDCFDKNPKTGRETLTLTDDAMQGMGIKNEEHRKMLAWHIARLTTKSIVIDY